MPRSYKKREQERKRMLRVKYLLVVSLAVLIVAAAFLMIPDKTKRNPGGDIDASSETQDEAAREKEQKISKKQKLFGEKAFQVVDSTYRSADGYSWEDMYTLLTLLDKTTPLEEGETPAFTLLQVPESQAPLLLVGKKTAQGEEQIEIYVISNEKVYCLLKTTGTFEANVELGILYERKSNQIYDYTPHNLKAYDGALFDLEKMEFKPIAYTNVQNETEPITVERIQNYILKEGKEAQHE